MLPSNRNLILLLRGPLDPGDVVRKPFDLRFLPEGIAEVPQVLPFVAVLKWHGRATDIRCSYLLIKVDFSASI